jgi:hypothetical protein
MKKRWIDDKGDARTLRGRNPPHEGVVTRKASVVLSRLDVCSQLPKRRMYARVRYCSSTGSPVLGGHLKYVWRPQVAQPTKELV